MAKEKETKIRMGRGIIIGDKKVCDLTCSKLQLDGNLDIANNYYFIKKSEVNLTKWALELGFRDYRTIQRKLKYLIKVDIVKDEGDHYIVPIATKFYFDVEESTLSKLVSFARADSIRIYLYLLGWYFWCQNNDSGYFQFSLRSINKNLGLCDDGRARSRTSEILEMLERLGLIKVSDYTVRVGKGERRELLFASTKLPNLTKNN